VDLAAATIVGFVFGGLMTLLVSIFQRRTDREARAIERKYERLHTASRLIRLSAWQAVQLDLSRTVIGQLLEATSWGTKWTPRWQPFAYTIAEVGASLALVLDDVAGKALDEFEAAMVGIMEAKRSDRKILTRYVNAALALRRELEARARSLR